MTIPAVLYKYQSVTPRSIENLTNAQVWFSCPSTFNDPFDCRIRVDDTNLSESDCEALYDWLEKNHPAVDFRKILGCADPPKHPKFREMFLKSFDKLFSGALHRYSNECGVCCFT